MRDRAKRFHATAGEHTLETTPPTAPLGGNGLTHRARAGGRQIFASDSQFLDRFANQRAKLAISILLRVAVTDSTPREQVRAVAHVQTVFLFPADELQILVFGFHLVAWRMALRTCFS